MKTSLTDLIQVNSKLTTPVYKQIVQSICRNIEKGVLTKDDMLPSVNSIAETFSLARGSVFTAYNDLRSSGIIDSIPGKGYFVISTATKQHKNIFLLFNAFGLCNETLFSSLHASLPKNCAVDVYFHHYNMDTFETLISEKAGYYNTFVVMPEVNKDTLGILARLDQKHTFLLDSGFREYRKLYAGVYQNAEKDIYNLLRSMEAVVSKYKRLVLVCAEGARHRDMIAGFNKFSAARKMTAKTIHSIEAADVHKHDAFVVANDSYLVPILKAMQQNNWKAGKDIGVISYNENDLKSVLADGITTITPDYRLMGKTIANMIVTGNREIVENPYVLIDRNSF